MGDERAGRVGGGGCEDGPGMGAAEERSEAATLGEGVGGGGDAVDASAGGAGAVDSRGGGGGEDDSGGSSTGTSSGGTSSNGGSPLAGTTDGDDEDSAAPTRAAAAGGDDDAVALSRRSSVEPTCSAAGGSCGCDRDGCGDGDVRRRDRLSCFRSRRWSSSLSSLCERRLRFLECSRLSRRSRASLSRASRSLSRRRLRARSRSISAMSLFSLIGRRRSVGGRSSTRRSRGSRDRLDHEGGLGVLSRRCAARFMALMRRWRLSRSASSCCARRRKAQSTAAYGIVSNTWMG